MAQYLYYFLFNFGMPIIMDLTVFDNIRTFLNAHLFPNGKWTVVTPIDACCWSCPLLLTFVVDERKYGALDTWSLSHSGFSAWKLIVLHGSFDSCLNNPSEWFFNQMLSQFPFMIKSLSFSKTWLFIFTLVLVWPEKLMLSYPGYVTIQVSIHLQP